jgi:hypothetical protein
MFLSACTSETSEIHPFTTLLTQEEQRTFVSALARLCVEDNKVILGDADITELPAYLAILHKSEFQPKSKREVHNEHEEDGDEGSVEHEQNDEEDDDGDDDDGDDDRS